MRQKKERLRASGVHVVVVTFAEEEHALNYQKQVGLEWPLAVDRGRKMYDYFGLARAGFWDIWGPVTWYLYLKEMLRGNMPKLAGGDVYQQGGDVLIDPQGIVRLHYIGKGPGDRPAVDSILEIVERFNRKIQKG